MGAACCNSEDSDVGESRSYEEQAELRDEISEKRRQQAEQKAAQRRRDEEQRQKQINDERERIENRMREEAESAERSRAEKDALQAELEGFEASQVGGGAGGGAMAGQAAEDAGLDAELETLRAVPQTQDQIKQLPPEEIRERSSKRAAGGASGAGRLLETLGRGAGKTIDRMNARSQVALLLSNSPWKHGLSHYKSSVQAVAKQRLARCDKLSDLGMIELFGGPTRADGARAMDQAVREWRSEWINKGVALEVSPQKRPRKQDNASGTGWLSDGWAAAKPTVVSRNEDKPSPKVEETEEESNQVEAALRDSMTGVSNFMSKLLD